jgi:acyl-CoA thioester hydrolase
MRAAGIPYTRLEAQGYFLPIVEAHLRYLSPARYDDPVEVVGWIRELRSRQVQFGYQLERDGKLLAEGWTIHIPMGRDGRPRAFTRELLEELGRWTVGEHESQ